jgi:nitroreductase
MNEVLQNITTRRSIRSYTDEQISGDDLHLLIEAARYAPSGSNSQSWNFTVIQNKEKIDRLNELVREAFKSVIVDETTYRSLVAGKKFAENENYHFCYHAPTLIIVSNERKYLNAMADCSVALQNIFLVANSLRLGSCWINQTRWFGDDPGVRKAFTELGIPEDYMVCGAAAVGHILGEIQKAPPRKDGNVTIIR